MTFRDLHFRDAPLVLPNAWDVPSALAFLDQGFPAIGTTDLPSDRPVPSVTTPRMNPASCCACACGNTSTTPRALTSP